MSVEGKSVAELSDLIDKNKIPCPTCGKFDWTPVRKFNLLFETHIGIVPEAQSKAICGEKPPRGYLFPSKISLIQAA